MVGRCFPQRFGGLGLGVAEVFLKDVVRGVGWAGVGLAEVFLKDLVRGRVGRGFPERFGWLRWVRVGLEVLLARTGRQEYCECTRSPLVQIADSLHYERVFAAAASAL